MYQFLTRANYHSHPAVSSSRLKRAITGTGRDYLHSLQVPFVPTDAMRQGSLCDVMITTPGAFLELYIVMPDDAPRRPTAKQLQDGRDSRPGTRAHDSWLDARDRETWWQAFELRASGREVISRDWADRASTIRDTLADDPIIGPVLRDAIESSQQPHLWVDAAGNVCRYLPDLETASGGLWDLKKARSANPRHAAAQAWQLAYDVQLAHYCLGYEDRHGQAPTRQGLITYEWEAPHNCCLMVATPELIQAGQQRRAEALERIARWKAEQHWPSHGEAQWDEPAWRKSGGEAPTEISEIVLF
jgi:PDDEXK-like domain of unknown function (DUF3799)